jgi:hypothetical protein
MSTRIRALFEQLQSLPFPQLGKLIGDFPLYDSLLAGTVTSYLAGAKLEREAIPVPDKEAADMVKALKKKPKLTRQESDFVKYAQLLNQLRHSVLHSLTPPRSRIG